MAVSLALSNDIVLSLTKDGADVGVHAQDLKGGPVVRLGLFRQNGGFHREGNLSRVYGFETSLDGFLLINNPDPN